MESMENTFKMRKETKYDTVSCKAKRAQKEKAHYCNVQSRHTWPRPTLPRSGPTRVATRLNFHPRFVQ